MNRAAVSVCFLILMGLVAGCGKKDKGAAAVEGKSDTTQQPRPDTKTSTGQHPAAGPKSNLPTVQRPAKQQQAIDALLKMHGTVLVDPTKPDQPVIKVVLRKSAGNTIRGSDLESIAALDTIEELDLQSTSITDITHVAGLKRLTVFSTPPLTPDQFGIIASLPSLESLSCTIKKPEVRRSTDSSVPVKDRRKAFQEANSEDFVQQALLAISQSKSIRNLRVQQFNGVRYCTDNSFSPIPRLSNLRYFEVSGLSLTDPNVASISECKTVETLVLHGNLTGAGIRRLSSCNTLKTLDMRGINDGTCLAPPLRPALRNWRS